MSSNKNWQKLPCLACFLTVLLMTVLFYQRALAQASVSDSYFKVLSHNCVLSEHCAEIDIKKSQGMAKIVSDDEYNGFTAGINLEGQIVAIAQTQKEADLLAKHPREVFYVLKGQTLKETIERWLSYQEIKLIWEAPVDYKLAASAVFEGQLFAKDGALNSLLKAFEEADHPLQAELKANHVLVIKVKSYSSNMVVMQN